MIRRRLARLPEQTKALLSVAAVIGNDFDLATLEAVSRLDSGETEDALDVALVSGLVADDAGPPGRYRFSHALVRDTIYASVGAVRRARLHANVGAALEARGDVDSHLAQLAHHFALAAPVLGPAEGVDYLTTRRRLGTDGPRLRGRRGPPPVGAGAARAPAARPRPRSS